MINNLRRPIIRAWVNLVNSSVCFIFAAWNWHDGKPFGLALGVGCFALFVGLLDLNLVRQGVTRDPL